MMLKVYSTDGLLLQTYNSLNENSAESVLEGIKARDGIYIQGTPLNTYVWRFIPYHMIGRVELCETVNDPYT